MNAKKSKPILQIALFVLAISTILVLVNPLQVVQWKLSDLFFRGRSPADAITIIAIDDKSLSSAANLGRFKDWPRSYYSQFLRTIKPLSPAVVAFDLDFREPSRGMSDLRVKQLLREYERRNATPSGMEQRVNLDWYGLLKKFETGGTGTSTHPDDTDFQKAISESGPVILSSSLIFSDTIGEMSEEFPPYKGLILPIFSGENVSTGFQNVMRDRDGIIRRFAPSVPTLGKNSNGSVKSFAQTIADLYRQSKNQASVSAADEEQDSDESGDARAAAESGFSNVKQIPINFAAKPFSYKIISFADVLAGTFDKSAIEGKIIMVGATAGILQDFHPTPTSRDFMPGVELHANLAQQLLEGKKMSEQGFWGTFFMMVIFSFTGAFLLFSSPLRYLGLVFAAALIGYPLAAFAMYQTGVALNIVYPLSAWILAGLAVLWYRNKTEIRATNEIKKAFSHYVSPIVVNELAKDPSALKLGGKRQKITVLFSDIVGFTTLAEKLTPEDTVALLNDYLTAMTEVIFSYNGTLDKYQGDAIMALFGAPLDDPHQAVNACQTALGMRRALTQLHEKWNAIAALPFKDELIKLDFRVGIATGQAVVGNVGSEKRFDYTAIGDIVNLGSRLESVNKKYGTRIMLDKDTFTTVTDNHNPFVYRKLDTVRVKGKQQETEIFELVSLAENTTSDMKTMLDEFENGRIMYCQKNFIDAKQFFESAISRFPQDGPSQIYRNRCNYFLRKPPGRDWDAVVNLEEK